MNVGHPRPDSNEKGHTHNARNRRRRESVAAGTSIASAVVVVVTIGLAEHFLQGIAAIAKDEVFVVGIEYVYKFDLTTWGWIHLILGVLVVLVGCVLFTGATVVGSAVDSVVRDGVRLASSQGVLPRGRE